jgi:hypothetical protein
MFDPVASCGATIDVLAPVEHPCMACRHLLAIVSLNSGAMGHCQAAHTGFMPNLRAGWVFEVIQTAAFGVRF